MGARLDWHRDSGEADLLAAVDTFAEKVRRYHVMSMVNYRADSHLPGIWVSFARLPFVHSLH